MFSINWKLLGFLATLCILNVCEAQITSIGDCPNVNVMPDFNLTKYMGVWYEQEKYPISGEDSGKCIKAEYTLKTNGDVNVVNSELLKEIGDVETIQGYATDIVGAKLQMILPVGQSMTSIIYYWVLDTDYSSYSAVYSCYYTQATHHKTMVWILTRKRKPSDDVIEKAEEGLKKNNIDLKYLVKTDQTGCDIKA